MSAIEDQKPARIGRPPKFREPRRPVTVTLPDRIIQQLSTVDPDRAQAIVRSVELACQQQIATGLPVDVRPVSEDYGLIIIGPCPSIHKVACLQMVEVAPQRFLLAVAPGTTAEVLEIHLLDLLENMPADAAQDRRVIEELRARIADLRRAKRVTRAEILFVRRN